MLFVRLSLAIVIMLSFTIELASSQPVLTMECRKLYKAYKNKKKHKAFVKALYDETEYCALASSKKSEKAAIAAAMERCKSIGYRDCVRVTSE